MTPRPLLAATVALCATLPLAACNNSPEAGHPNTTPITSTTPTPTAPSTPTYTPEEQTAITAAKTGYAAARAAVVKAVADPQKATRAGLEASGNGGHWLDGAIEQIVFLRDRSLYQTGEVKIVSSVVKSVDALASRPTVVFTNCVDGSAVVMRYKATGKAVPVVSTDGLRHKVDAYLSFAPSKRGTRMWYLTEEKVVGKC
jgi:hypothetical protein